MNHARENRRRKARATKRLARWRLVDRRGPLQQSFDSLPLVITDDVVMSISSLREEVRSAVARGIKEQTHGWDPRVKDREKRRARRKSDKAMAPINDDWDDGDDDDEWGTYEEMDAPLLPPMVVGGFKTGKLIADSQLAVVKRRALRAPAPIEFGIPTSKIGKFFGESTRVDSLMSESPEDPADNPNDGGSHDEE